MGAAPTRRGIHASAGRRVSQVGLRPSFAFAFWQRGREAAGGASCSRPNRHHLTSPAPLQHLCPLPLLALPHALRAQLLAGRCSAAQFTAARPARPVAVPLGMPRPPRWPNTCHGSASSSACRSLQYHYLSRPGRLEAAWAVRPSPTAAAFAPCHSLDLPILDD